MPTTLPPRIIAFGSSTILGRMDAAYGGFVARLRAHHEAQATKNIVYNLGIWGDTILGMINRISEVKIRKPHLIILYLGFNDIVRTGAGNALQSKPLDESLSEVQSLLNLLKDIAPVIFITGFPFDDSKTTPYLKGDSYYRLDDAKIYTEKLITLCSNAGIKVLDLFHNWPNDPSLLDSDGLHANTAGHEEIFNKLIEFLDILL